MRSFNYVVLTVAIIISVCAAYYSIVGLTAIFAAAFWPIIIMGTALEMGKLSAAIWLHLNWEHAQRWIKFYMVPAVAILMFITSMGIFGFLSRAHIEQTAGAGSFVTQIEKINLDIEIEKSKIDNNQLLVKQLDSAVNNLLATSATQGAQTKSSNARQASQIATQATKLRKTQEPERKLLQDQITEASQRIADLTKQKLEIEQQVKKIEAEVGPIKYVAALFNENPDVNMLEKAVRWMIIILVIVFDPLAVVLILAAVSGLRYGGPQKFRWDPPVEITSTTQSNNFNHQEQVVSASKEVETIKKDISEQKPNISEQDNEVNNPVEKSVETSNEPVINNKIIESTESIKEPELEPETESVKKTETKSIKEPELELETESVKETETDVSVQNETEDIKKK